MPQLLFGMAARGYVVVAMEAGLEYCLAESADQIRALQWAASDPNLARYIDVGNGTGLVGHSMGGGATIASASNAAAVATHSIKVAVAMHPARGACVLDCQPKVPTLFMTGDADTVVPPDTVKAQYTAALGVEKAFVENHGNTHTDATGWSFHKDGCFGFDKNGKCPAGKQCSCSGPNNEDVYAYDWLDCKLKADAGACARVTRCREPRNVAAQCNHTAAASLTQHGKRDGGASEEHGTQLKTDDSVTPRVANASSKSPTLKFPTLITVGASASVPEQRAAEELASYLNNISASSSFRVQPATAARKATPQIAVGYDAAILLGVHPEELAGPSSPNPKHLSRLGLCGAHS